MKEIFMGITEKQFDELLDYLMSVEHRYERMAKAGLDVVGYERLQKMITRFMNKGSITPGEAEYLFDRTHPAGRYPDYNTKMGFDVRFGYMETFPTEIMRDFVIDWSIPNTFKSKLI